MLYFKNAYFEWAPNRIIKTGQIHINCAIHSLYELEFQKSSLYAVCFNTCVLSDILVWMWLPFPAGVSMLQRLGVRERSWPGGVGLMADWGWGQRMTSECRTRNSVDFHCLSITYRYVSFWMYFYLLEVPVIFSVVYPKVLQTRTQEFATKCFLMKSCFNLS